MQLSEAIRLGAMLRPQAFGFYFEAGKSCAFGAAAEASGTTSGAWGRADLQIRGQWPWVFTTRARCPACLEPHHVRRIVAHLNNDHRWTRERIADWVESYERCVQPEPAPAVRLSMDEPGVAIRD